MPFDPTKPVAHTVNSAAEMRDQLNALKTLIDAVPVVEDAHVDGVTTVNPGDPAAAEVEFAGGDLHFSFDIPRGHDGPQGEPGDVSSQQLSDAIDGTANNMNGIGPYGGSFSDPPTQGEMQDFAAYVESLRAALVR